MEEIKYEKTSVAFFVSSVVSILFIFAFSLCLCIPALAQYQNTITSEQKQEWMSALAPARVRVAYTLMFADGEAPLVPGLAVTTRYLCPNCGQYHTNIDNNAERSIHEKRDAETWGWLVAPNTVLVQDAQIPRRFLKAIHVAQGETSVAAQESFYFHDRNAMLLTLEQPIYSASPLVFSRDKNDECFILTYTHEENDWQSTITPYVNQFIVDEVRGMLRIEEVSGIVLDSSGNPIRIAIAGQFTMAEYEWDKVSMADDEQRQNQIASYHNKSICLASLHFRSPRTTSLLGRYSYSLKEEDFENTVQYAVACKLSPGRFLILQALSHDATARLEKILISTSSSNSVEAAFVASLAEFGAFIAECGSVEFELLPVSETPSQTPLYGVFYSNTISVDDGELHSTLARRRVTSYVEGYEGALCPDIDNADKAFIFDAHGNLCFLPIVLLLGDNHDPMPYPALRLKDFSARLPDDAIDKTKHPLSVNEENRIAWFGAELQKVTPELALAYNAARFFENNRRQAGIIVYIYKDSPAERAGLQEDDIILRLYTPREPMPTPIKIEDNFSFGEAQWPWEQYDQIPVDTFENIPVTPWILASGFDILPAILTYGGIGNTCTLDFVRGGQLQQTQFTIEESPPYYESAERFYVSSYGITVCDITYEVRRYFNLAENAPGIIITSIDSGSSAAERGVKPYEIITHIDGDPVRHASEFSSLLEGKQEVRLTVRRMQKDRVVALKQETRQRGAPETF